MTPKELDQLIKKYLDGTCSNEEASLIERIYFMAGGLKPEMPPLNTEQELLLENRLKKKILDHTATSKRPLLSNRWYYAAAASIMLIVSVATYLQLQTSKPIANPVASIPKENRTYLSNSTEIPQTYLLPDGSFATLSPQSRLTVIFDSIPKSRIARLEGEVFFDVAPNKERPFYVLTQRVVTKVLGTRFNVKAFDADNDITVSVVEGKVSVSAANKESMNKEVILLPKQEAVFDKSLQTVTAKDVYKPIDTETNTPIKFREEAVATILKYLEKSYHVTIVFDEQAFSKCSITTTFVDESLRERLSIICAAIGATYKATDDYHLELENPMCSSN